MNSKKQLSKQGSVIVTLLIIMPFLLLIVAQYTQQGINSLFLARVDQYRSHAQLASDAGVDLALQEINIDNNWPGTPGIIELHNADSIKTSYEVSVTANNADSKTISSTGRTYKSTNPSVAISSVTIQVDLRAVRAGAFSVVSGVGGLYLSNSAKIVGGDVFVNGEINLSNSAQIGLTTNSVKVDVAHQNCPNPPDATYPRVCGFGENGQPITLNNSSKIYGTVRANNQTNGSSMLNPGLVAGSGVAAQPLPPHDRAAQKAAAIPPVAPYNGDWSCSSGNYTWPANLKIAGNVTISNSCKVTVSGDVWITGNLETKNSAQLIVSNTLGGTKPSIMVDGQTAQFNNSSKLVSNSSNTGFQVINYWSQAGCSPDCPDVTGQDLYNSRNVTTIKLDNSAEGPHTIFYSRWTRVQISNSGQIGALVGQTVELKNSGTLTFGTSVGVGNTYWVIDGYQRSF